MHARAIRPLMALAVMVLGFGLLAKAAYSIYDTRHFLAGARSTEGEVVEIVAGHTSRKTNQTTYAPMIAFEPVPGGETVIFKSGVAGNQSDYSVGDKVPVLFLPEAPQEARLGTVLGTQGREIMLALVGLIFIVVGRFVLMRRR